MYAPANVHSECELCKLLHAKDLRREAGDLNSGYWSKPKNCGADGWGYNSDLKRLFGELVGG